LALASNQFYPRKCHPIRVVFDTTDPDLTRSLAILQEADASGAFGTNRFYCRQIGPSLYEVAIYPGAALELLKR
jgi:hypothetical protein